MRQELLPLFPLQLVLLPKTPIALHIFEERYKEMIGESIARNSEFGIVLASDKGIVNAGCTAVVDKVVQQYPDGRMDIIAVGRRRFEIQELNSDYNYLRGAVEYYDDNEDDVDLMPDTVRTHVIERYQQLINEGAGSPSVEPELDDDQVSFQLAQAVSDLTLRQLLLMSKSEAERMKQLAAYLPELLRTTEEISQARHAASSNGHGKRPAGL